MVSTAVPGGSTPGLAGAAWSDEQPAVTPINSIAAAATQTRLSTAGISRRPPAAALRSSRDRSYLQLLSDLHNANMSATSSVAGPQELLLQLLDPANRANPYAVYQQFRDLGPVQVPDGNLTVFSSYRECDEALRHPSSSVDRFKSTMAKRMFAEGARARPLGPPMFLFLDPPDHTRLRKLVSKAFVPKVVNELQPDITELVDGLLDRIAERGRFDVVSDLAYPLPVAVICRLLGVPLEDEPGFSHASALLAQALDPFVTFTGSASDGLQERLDAGAWLREYLHGLIERRRSHPGDDLMSGLVAVE